VTVYISLIYALIPPHLLDHLIWLLDKITCHFHFQTYPSHTNIALNSSHSDITLDNIWGIGYDAATAKSVPRDQWGENLLGVALMKVRERIRSGEAYEVQESADNLHTSK
jgi:hypothetical protein